MIVTSKQVQIQGEMKAHGEGGGGSYIKRRWVFIVTLRGFGKGVNCLKRSTVDAFAVPFNRSVEQTKLF